MPAAFQEQPTLGRVTTEAMIENIRDLWELESSQRSADKVRRITVQDALVDTGASEAHRQSSPRRRLGNRDVLTSLPSEFRYAATPRENCSTRWAYSPLAASSSACVPRWMMRPFSRTRI
jgi:hypothetical protein